MAGQPPRLTVVIIPSAQRDLEGIWDYNAEAYGADHAQNYIHFLKLETAKLETDHERGQLVPNHPEYRYTIIRRRRGHGHLIFYRVRHHVVEVIHYFHTAQNWQSHLS